MGEDGFLLDGVVMIDGKAIPISELNFCCGFDPAVDDSEGTGMAFYRPDIGEISCTFKMSRKTTRKLLVFLGLVKYKPSRLRSAIGLKRRIRK